MGGVKLSEKSKGTSVAQVLRFAFLVCLVTSVVVSFVAVLLKERQEENKILDKQKNILIAAGLVADGEKVDKARMKDLFRNVKAVSVDLNTGEVVTGFDLAKYDQYKASKDVTSSKVLSSGQDIALLRRRETVGFVYHIFDDSKKLLRFVVPIRGYGLWSTLHGFLALSVDGRVVEGITFYEHAETPGLGGEVDNSNWKALWRGKIAYNKKGDVALYVVKGRAQKGAVNHVDGISGATITSRGVTKMVHYWLGDDGYGKYIKENFLFKNREN